MCSNIYFGSFQVNKIITFFESPSFIDKVAQLERTSGSQNPISTLKHLIENIISFKTLCGGLEDNNIEINALLFQGDLLLEVKKALETYEPLWKIIEGSVNKRLAWSIKEILQLELPLRFKQLFDSFISKSLTPIGLISYYMDPQSDRKILKKWMVDKILQVGMISFEDKTEVGQLLDYHRQDPPFNDRNKNDLEYLQYWRCYEKGSCEFLAKYALKLYDVPSSSHTKHFNRPNDSEDNILAIKFAFA